MRANVARTPQPRGSAAHWPVTYLPYGADGHGAAAPLVSLASLFVALARTATLSRPPRLVVPAAAGLRAAIGAIPSERAVPSWRWPPRSYFRNAACARCSTLGQACWRRPNSSNSIPIVANRAASQLQDTAKK